MSSTATVEMARNTTQKPLVFSDSSKGIVIEFGKAGAEDGSDVQAVPEEAMKLPQFARLLQRGMIEMLDGDASYVQEAGDKAVASAEARNQQYKSKIEDAREADPQQRDLVFKVEESERQGKVPVYTQVEDEEPDAKVTANAEAGELGTVAGAGEADEEGKPTTTDVKVTIGEPLPSES